MTLEQTTAQLIATAIHDFLEKKTVTFGVLARSLPSFDPDTFYKVLKPEPAKLRLALVGFGEITRHPPLPDYIATTAEEAVAWRNAKDIDARIVVILGAEAGYTQEKINSLEVLEPFTDANLCQSIYKQGIKWAQGSADNSKKLLWESLGKVKQFSLVAHQLATLYHILQTHNITVALPYINLLPDPEFAEYFDSSEKLLKRLGNNYDNVQWLLTLDNKAYRTLARTLSENEKHQYSRTFRLIKKYAQKPCLETLQPLTLDAVIAIRRARKTDEETLIDTQETTNRVHQRRNKMVTPDQYFVDALLQLDLFQEEDKEELERLSDWAHRFNNWICKENNEEQDYYAIIADRSGEEYVFKKPEQDDLHPLEEFIQKKWVSPECWGGCVKIEPSTDEPLSVPELFDRAIAPDFVPFLPLGNPKVTAKQTVSTLLTWFTKLEQETPQPDHTGNLAELLQELHKHRTKLVKYRRLFLYYPTLAIVDHQLFTIIKDYIATYEKLSSRLQQIYIRARVNNPDTIEIATAQFLALDAVIIEHQESVAVILTTLHPLHLWKWAELARLIQNNQKVLTDKEREIAQESVRTLPTLLNTFLLHSKMFAPPRHIDEPRLVVAGEINNPKSKLTVGISYYEPVAHQFPTVDGLKEFAELFGNFLTLYPPARLGLVLALIDPPQISPILKQLVQLHDKEILHGVKIYIYVTDKRSSVYDMWQSGDDEALELFREHSHWTVTVDLECDNCDKIVDDLADKQPHIILLCDPSEAIAQPIFRTIQEETTPFGVPVQLTYDSITDTIKLIPTPGGGIFDIYTGLRNALSGELQQRSIGVGNRKKAGINLKALIHPENGANWLVVIDRAHGTLELPGDIGRRLAWYSVRSRTLSVHTNERDWQQYWHEQLKTTLSSLGLPEFVTTDYIQNCLLEIFPVLPEGLLTVIDQSEPGESITLGKAFSQSALGRLLSIIITLRWYRSDKPGLVLIPIDGEDFRDWYHENEPLKFKESAVHFIAMWFVQEKLYADVLTIHPYQTSFDGNLPDLSEAKANFQQLVDFAQTLESLFVGQADVNILTPLRRALLRERLSIAVFAAPQTTSTSVIGQSKDTKIQWANAINNLFTEYIPQIRLLDVRVALQEANQPPDEQQSYYEHELDSFQRVIVKLPGTLLRPISAPTVVESQQELTTIPKVMETQIPFPLNGRKSEQPQKPSDVFPSPETEPETTDSSEQTDVTLQEDIQKQAEQLRRVLIAYGIAIAGIETEKTQIGPRFIRYWVKLQPPAGRLSEVQKFAVDIARELSSNTVPFIDNIPGERYIGIDLAREHPETISLIPILDNLPPEQPYELIIAGGQNAAGEDVPFDIVRLPHILVAGSTGSGKTVFLSCLIMSLAWRHPANEVQLLLIDPKQTDFVVFSELPHLHDKRIYYEPEDAVTVLRELISNEKERRTKLLHQSRCPNILEYNRRNPSQRLPWIVVVIDEFADIILTLSRRERGEFERQINRLAGTGRSVGIHLILATQRPTTDVVTGTIKANIPARVSFRLPSVTDSRTILDRPGAENLLGRGDMLISVNGEIQRLQGYNVSYDELTQLLLQIK